MPQWADSEDELVNPEDTSRQSRRIVSHRRSSDSLRSELSSIATLPPGTPYISDNDSPSLADNSNHIEGDVEVEDLFKSDKNVVFSKTAAGRRLFDDADINDSDSELDSFVNVSTHWHLNASVVC